MNIQIGGELLGRIDRLCEIKGWTVETLVTTALHQMVAEWEIESGIMPESEFGVDRSRDLGEWPQDCTDAAGSIE